MNKYIVAKKVFATELVWVEAGSEGEAVDLVAMGEGIPTQMDFEWDGDLPSHFWSAHQVDLRGEDVETHNEYAQNLLWEEEDASPE